jgi:predicted transcriptional regulator
MAANKRTRHTREQDLVTIARLHRLGYEQMEIAEQLGVSQQQVSYDLRTLNARWRQASFDDTAAEKQEILAEERWIKRQAREEYSRSRACTKKERKKLASTGTNGKERREAMTETQERFGDPRYLAIIQASNKAIREIRGLDAPKNIHATVASGTLEVTEVVVRTREEAAQALSAMAEAGRIPGKPSDGEGLRGGPRGGQEQGGSV